MEKPTITRKTFLYQLGAILGLLALGRKFWMNRPDRQDRQEGNAPAACDHCGNCTARFCRYYKG